MRITGTQTNYPQVGAKMPQNADGAEKSMRSRIEGLRDQLRQLSENERIDPKEKMKKKQEIEQQISELEEQLRQHMNEKEREKAQSAQAAPEKKYDRFEPGSGYEEMKNAVSADISVEQAQVRGSAARSLNGRANVIESEIRQDASRGVSAEKKREELAKLRSRARKAENGQAEELSKASEKSAAGSRTAAGLSYLMSLKDKLPGTAFFIGTVSYGQTCGNSTDNNFAVHPKYLEKLAGDPDERKNFEETVDHLNNYSKQFRMSQAAQGREVISEGWFCDENGNWGGWSVTRRTDRRSHLQEMRDEADKINEKKAERKKEAGESEKRRLERTKTEGGKIKFAVHTEKTPFHDILLKSGQSAPIK